MLECITKFAQSYNIFDLQEMTDNEGVATLFGKYCGACMNVSKVFFFSKFIFLFNPVPLVVDWTQQLQL